MKTLNRTLLALVAAVGVAVVWSLISKTEWADSVSLLGVGHDYANAFQPLVKVTGAMVLMVAGTLLVQRTNRWARTQLRATTGPAESPDGNRGTRRRRTALRDKLLILVSGLKP